MKSTRVRKITLSLAALAAVGLFMPFSNLFLHRPEPLQVEGSDEFKKVSLVLQQKCADCHTPNRTAYPVYTSLPIANRVIETDIEEAQKHIIFSDDMLRGKTPITAIDKAKIQSAFLDGGMPPLKYLALHWDARITRADKEAILTWLQSEKPLQLDTAGNQEQIH